MMPPADEGEPRRSRVGVLAPLRSRAFATLFVGYALSAMGDGMAVVAVS
jgi:hypothetical protein